MTNVATLSVDVIAHDKVSAVLTKLDGQLARTNQGAVRAGRGIGDGISSGTQKAASGALALQQAQARLEAQQGNLAGAAQRLQNALAQVGTTSVQTVNAQRQLLTVQTQMATGTSALGGHFQALGGAIGGLPGQLLSVSGGLAAVGVAAGAAVSVVQSFGEAFKFKAELDATTRSIHLQLKGVRDSNAVFTEGQAFAAKYGLTQQELTDAIQSSIGVMRQSTASTTDLFETLSRLQVLAPEKPISEAARALRELASGDVTTIRELFNIAASDANRMKAEILAGGDAVAVLSAHLDNTGIGMDTLAARTEGAKGKFIELAQAQEQLTLAQAAFAEGPGLAILQQQIALISGSTRILTGDTAAMEASFVQAGNSGSFAFHLLNAASGGALANQLRYKNAMAETTAETAAAAPVIVQTATAFDAYTAAATASADAAFTATAAQTALTGELGLNAQAAVLAAAQQDAQSQATANLKAQTDAAVSSFLALNPSIDGAGIAAQVAAGKIPALVGQLASLRVAAYSARDAVAALAAQQAINTKVLAAPGVGAVGRTSGRNNDVDAVYELQKANAAAAKARVDQVKAIGSEQQKLNAYEQDYAAAVKESGATSAAAINAETRLKQEQIAASKAAVKAAKGGGGAGGGGGGGGATKLSDQQKLNNTLLAKQTQFDQKTEDAERAHLDRLLSINEDYQEKMKDAQDNFAQSRLDGDASFYSALGDVTDHGLQQAMSAQYEAAFLEAEQIAKTKGADVADAFLKAKEAQILAQGKRSAEIANAEKEGDAGKAEYLRGVDAKYKAAEERRLAAIAAGEDSVAAQRDKALAEESAKYEASQEKLGTSAERAGERAITAAQARGAAIDAEALKVDGLAAKYDGLNGASTRAGVTPAGTLPGASTAATTSPAASGATEAGNPVLAALEALRAAFDSAAAQIVAAERDTTAAVRRITTSGGIAG